MKTTKRKRESAAAPAAAAAAPAPAPAKGKVAAPVIALASNCGVKDAAQLKQSLCEVAQQSVVSIDVGRLERIDTATMQLLCAFVRDRAAREQKVEWLGNSQALHEAARLLGVRELLALAPESDAKNLGAAA